MIKIRPIIADDRAPLERALRSDDSFRTDEIAVALELIEDALGGSNDYQVQVAQHEPQTGALRDIFPAKEVVGYICYGQTPMTASTYDLYWVVVHAKARGQGVAGLLIRAMEEKLAAMGATAIRVETSSLAEYGAARTLYAKYRYPEVARLVDFYRNGDDLIVYYKKL